MLGDKIGDVRGQMISQRVLADEGQGPRMEVTDQQVGTLCGVSITTTVTYTGTMRPTGHLFGEAVGVVMSTEGETATFRGIGVGTLTPTGTATWRGSLVYESPTPKLARLNGIATLFEYSVDEGGKSEGHLFEWK
jgi:hypothetical protein